MVRGTLCGTRPVAVRLVPADKGPDGEPILPPELTILRSIECGQVVAFLGACVAGDELRLACELMEGGDLGSALAGSLEAGGGGVRWAGGRWVGGAWIVIYQDRPGERQGCSVCAVLTAVGLLNAAAAAAGGLLWTWRAGSATCTPAGSCTLHSNPR